MSGVPSAMLARERFDDAAAAAIEFEEIMGKGNYFLEIQEHGLEPQARIRKPLIDLSKRTGIPLVATNDAHYLIDRKSTRLNSSHVEISYAVFCLKKKKKSSGS